MGYSAGVNTSPSTEAAGLRIGFVPGVTLAKWRRVWAERFPRVPLEIVAVEEERQREVIDAGDVDMCFVRLPLDTDGLHAIPLYEETPVVWMSKDHVLAELDELTTDDLADERVLTDMGKDSVDLATYSAAVLRIPMSIARSHNRRDMVHRPVIDAEPTTVALAWRVDDDNEWIEQFIGVVRGRTPNSSRTPPKPGAPEPTKQVTKRRRPATRSGKRPRRR